MRTSQPRPCWRASSHDSSAVRRLPRCRSPVGDGAKRPEPAAGCTRATLRVWPERGCTPRRYPAGVPCPTCGAETRPGQRFCAECGDRARHGTGVTPRRRTSCRPRRANPPSRRPSSCGSCPPDAAQPPPAPVPIRIVEQTSPLPTTGTAPARCPRATGPQAAQHQIGGMVWRPIAVDPWPTPRSSPTVVAAPLRPGPLDRRRARRRRARRRRQHRHRRLLPLRRRHRR